MGYDIDEAKALVIRAGKELVEKGLIARTWGNISARISYSEFVITPSGRSYDSLTPDDLVVVDLDGNYEGNIKPSSEKKVHAEAYRHRQDVNFVIHTHQVNASAISVLGKSIPFCETVSEEIKTILGPKIVCANYGLSSTDKLKRAVSAAIAANPECNHVLMKYHGAICMGADYDSAFKVADTLEEVCGKIYTKYVGEPLVREPYIVNEVLPPVYEDLDSAITGAEAEECADAPIEEPMVVLHAQTPYTVKMSELGDTMQAYSDDLAQIAGPVVYCAPADASFDEIDDTRGKYAAVFVKGKGAYCYGTDRDEAEAVVQVLEKACQAAYLGFKKGAAPVNIAGAILEHEIYVKKYSKLKDK